MTLMDIPPREQTAVYWALLSHDDSGQPTYVAPIEIACRWDKTTVEFVDMNGDRQASNAKVFPDQEVDVIGVLFLGELTDLTDEDDPKSNFGAWEIRRFDIIKSFDQSEELYIAYL